MSTTSPNMNLILSTVNVDSGLLWEQNLNASLTTVDGHNHTSGNGVQIPAAGLNINAALSFQNQQAINLQATTFQQQSSLATLNALFVGTDGNLYFNDGVGDPSIQMTLGGGVNATSSGITGSGGASAAFTTGVLIVQSATNTPGNISGGSLLMGNVVASSKFLTLSPPASMGTNYTITLPPLSSLSTGTIVTTDGSGNLGTTTPDAVGTSMTATGANAIAASRTRATGSTVGVGGVAVDTVSSYSNATTLLTTVASVTITTSGRPVVVMLIAEDVLVSSGFSLTSTGSSNLFASFRLNQGSTGVGATTVGQAATSAVLTSIVFPPSQIQFLDFPAAGTYTYTIKASLSLSATGSPTLAGQNFSMTAYEL